MKAMILAAGRGERMKPLTDNCPKPLLTVNGTPLIEHHIKKLAQVGIKDIVINHAWLGKMLEDYLKDGGQWQIKITYSAEQPALETAGGIINALPLLGNQPFLVINGDVFSEFDFSDLPILAKETLAHLWLVNNPDHNATGDFALTQGVLQNKILDNNRAVKQKTYTYSGIALFKPEFFAGKTATTVDQGPSLPLAPMLRRAAEQGLITASVLSCAWADVGTPQRLAQLNVV